jgi:thiamine transport system ATP-binding protein
MLGLERLRVTQGDFRLDRRPRVPAGAICAIVGPSGAGKSTLLASSPDSSPPPRAASSGTARTIDRPAAGRPAGEIVFQDNNLFPHLTCARTWRSACRPSLKLAPEETARRSRRPWPAWARGARRAEARRALGRAAEPRGARPGAGAGPAAHASRRALLGARPGARTEMLDLVRQVADEDGNDRPHGLARPRGRPPDRGPDDVPWRREGACAPAHGRALRQPARRRSPPISENENAPRRARFPNQCPVRTVTPPAGPFAARLTGAQIRLLVR